MLLLRLLVALCAMVVLSAPAEERLVFAVGPQAPEDWPEPAGDLSILSYNIKGLPWPAASNRSPALRAIGERLQLMRKRGVQPHIVLLQEAFTADAKQIAAQAGYRFVARGPDLAIRPPHPPLGAAFAHNARWDKGERSGNLLDSGLLILSDYPIVETRKYAFPEGACAGFDCLASKGVLIAWVEVPGVSVPLAVVDTHLNSRRATRVSPARADKAYAWQVRAVRRFLEREIPADAPVVFGGDFNVGEVGRRERAFGAAPLLGSRQRDSLRVALKSGDVLSSSQPEAHRIFGRNKDKIIYRSGSKVALVPRRAWVPFGLEPGGGELSDHSGFVIDYRLAADS